MKIASILNQSSMPIASPSYPRGPYRFIDREYFIVAIINKMGKTQVNLKLIPDYGRVLYDYLARGER